MTFCVVTLRGPCHYCHCYPCHSVPMPLDMPVPLFHCTVCPPVQSPAQGPAHVPSLPGLCLLSLHGDHAEGQEACPCVYYLTPMGVVHALLAWTPNSVSPPSAHYQTLLFTGSIMFSERWICRSMPSVPACCLTFTIHYSPPWCPHLPHAPCPHLPSHTTCHPHTHPALALPTHPHPHLPPLPRFPVHAIPYLPPFVATLGWPPHVWLPVFIPATHAHHYLPPRPLPPTLLDHTPVYFSVGPPCCWRPSTTPYHHTQFCLGDVGRTTVATHAHLTFARYIPAALPLWSVPASRSRPTVLPGPPQLLLAHPALPPPPRCVEGCLLY